MDQRTIDQVDARITGLFNQLGLTGLSRADDVGYDVYLLAGQSNMSGRGYAYDAVNYDPQSVRIQQFATAGPLAGVIAQAQEPLGFADYLLTIGMGPGLVFARWMEQATPTNRRILLVPVAYGGTGFSTGVPLGWDPAATGNLYTQAITQANNAMTAAGSNARFAGILWVQGEQDATMNPTTYATKLDALITGFRSGITGASATTPFVLGRMAPGFVNLTSGAQAIEAVHLATPARNTYCFIAAGPSGYDDNLHYNAAGQRTVGRNLFYAFLTAKDSTAAQPLILPVAVTGLNATVTGTGVGLVWVPQSRTASYKIERSTDGGSTYSTLAATVYGNTYAATIGLTAGAAIYRVSGQNVVGLGAFAATAVTLTAPGQVNNLTSPTQGSTVVNLAWTAVVVNGQAVTYLVEYSTDGGATWATSSTVSTVNASVASLTASTSYKFRVSAKSAGLTGTTSTVLTQATSAPVTVSDSFTRADSSSGIGGSWGTTSGTWGIRSNTAYLVTVLNSGTPYNVVPYAVGASDGTVSVDVTGTNIDSGAAGLVVRASDLINYFGFRLGGGQVQPYKMVNGVNTSLATMPFTHTSSGTVTLSVVMAGSTLIVKANGTTVGTITDTFNQAATNHGLWGLAVNTNSSLDNFAFNG